VQNIKRKVNVPKHRNRSTSTVPQRRFQAEKHFFALRMALADEIRRVKEKIESTERDRARLEDRIKSQEDSEECDELGSLGQTLSELYQQELTLQKREVFVVRLDAAREETNTHNWNPWARPRPFPEPTPTAQTAVAAAFGHRCPVSLRSTSLVVVPILPTTSYHAKIAFDRLRWAPSDLTRECNLMLMQKRFMTDYNDLLWTFIPIGGKPVTRKGREWYPYTIKTFAKGAPSLAKMKLKGTTFWLPASISRCALYYHTFGAHQRHGVFAAMPPPECY